MYNQYGYTRVALWPFAGAENFGRGNKKYMRKVIFKNQHERNMNVCFV